MHSRILQLSRKGPVSENDYINEDMFIDNNYCGIPADYVGPSDDISDDFIRFCDLMVHTPSCTCSIEDQVIMFDREFKRNYFGPKYEKLREIVYEMTLDQFSSYDDDIDGRIAVLLLGELIDDRRDLYIYLDGSTMTLDNFVRYIEPNTPYHFGTSLDYHA